MENLVTNTPSGCLDIDGPDHIQSMLGTGAEAPDIVILQQVRGLSQITAYANQLASRFGYAAGEFGVMVAWDDPEEWGSSHGCGTSSAQVTLGNKKKKQTNGIIWNKRTLTLQREGAYWSTAWDPTPTGTASVNDCVAYNTSGVTDGSPNVSKWKRTSAKIGQFTYNATGTTIAVASQHLPEKNNGYPCGNWNPKTTGIGGSGIYYGSGASNLLLSSTLRIVGIDANATPSRVPSNVLYADYGMSGVGTGNTIDDNGGSSPTRKIDYLFTNGSVQPSSDGNTRPGTLSNHKALYAFIDL